MRPRGSRGPKTLVEVWPWPVRNRQTGTVTQALYAVDGRKYRPHQCQNLLAAYPKHGCCFTHLQVLANPPLCEILVDRA